jgi:hypothetical protein
MKPTAGVVIRLPALALTVAHASQSPKCQRRSTPPCVATVAD